MPAYYNEIDPYAAGWLRALIAAGHLPAGEVDERDIRELISDILKDEGYGTRLAGGSEQAMKEVNLEAPDLIILDIWLKDSKMDGIDILKTVKRDNPEVPVVIISGHGNIEIAVAAVKQGAYDFIHKPIKIDELDHVVTKVLETRRLSRELAALQSEPSHLITTGSFIGRSDAMLKISKEFSQNRKWHITQQNGKGEN